MTAARAVETLGARLRRAREARGRTQEDLVGLLRARGVRIRLRTLQRYERDVTEPKPGTLQAIASILGCSISSLMSGAT